MKQAKHIVLASVMVIALGMPALGARYAIDSAHSEVGFSVRHLGVARVKGAFQEFEGTLVWDDKDLKTAAFSGTVNTSSINTRNNKRDEHLRSADFFNTKKYPQMKLKSKKVLKKGTGYEMTADLTILNVTKEVKIPLVVNGPVKDPWGSEKAGFEASFEINRHDYGLTYNKVLEAGGVLVGDKVLVDIIIEAKKI